MCIRDRFKVDHPLVVPVDKKVRIITTANDVIHAWMVPSFGVKQDAIPGCVRDSWFRAEKVGTFRGQCAELCGKEHGFMPVVVEVKSKEDYAKWAAEQKAKVASAAEDPSKVWDEKALAERGEKVFATNCAACHQATGKGVPGAFPALDGSKLVRGPAADQIALDIEGGGRVLGVEEGDQLRFVALRNLPGTAIEPRVTALDGDGSRRCHGGRYRDVCGRLTSGLDGRREGV